MDFTNQFSGGPGLQTSAAYQTGFFAGQALIWLLLLGLTIQFFSVARRPTANTKCALSLAIIFLSWLVLALTGAIARQSPRLMFLYGIVGLVLMGGMVAALVLAIIGLAEYQSQKDRWTQGKAMAIWTLVLCSFFMAVAGYGFVKGILRSRAGDMAFQMKNQPSSGEVLKFEDLNFKLRVPAKPWVQIDIKKFNANGVVGFMHPAPCYFAISAEKVGSSGFVTADSMVEIVKANMRSRASSMHVWKEAPLRLQGLDGVEIESEVEAFPYHIFYRHWICVTNGYGYQLMGWGSYTNEFTVREKTRELFEGFSLIDAHRQARNPLALSEAGDYRSTNYNYRVKLEGSAWRSSALMAKNMRGAESTFWDESQNVGLFIIPIHLMGQNPPVELVAGGLMGVAGYGYPNDAISDEKAVEEGAMKGTEFSYERPATTGKLAYRIRILKGQEFAYLIGSYCVSKGVEDRQKLDSALARVTFTESGGLVSTNLTARDKEREAAAFNEMGLIHYKNREYDRSAPCFQNAFELQSTSSTYLQNYVNASINLGKRQQALDFMDAFPEVVADSKSLRAIQAYLEMQLDQTDKALANFGSLFAQGYQNDDYFTEYIDLLIFTKQHDTAMTEVENYLAKKDSPAVRLLQARLYKQKKNYTKAIELLKEQCGKHPYNSDLTMGLADADFQAGLYGETVTLCQQLIDQQIETVGVYYLKGCAEFALKRYREAKVSFEAAQKKSPASTEVKSYLDLVSGMLGEGSNSALKEPISAVPIPEKLLTNAAPDAPATYLKDYGARYLKSIMAISYRKGKEFKTTDYQAVKLLDASGVAAFSTMQVSFDPLSENIYVNDLKVTDEDGKLVASGNVADYYVVDNSSSGQATHKKVLNIPVPGLRPGCKIELTVTRQEAAPPDAFPFQTHVCSATFPMLQDTYLIRGDTNAVKFIAPVGAVSGSIEDGLYWTLEQPPVYKWEPLEQTPGNFLPTFYFGDRDATWEGETKHYLEKLHDYMQLDAAQRELALKLTTNLGSDGEKVFALARHVQTNYTYKAIEFGRRARIPHKTSEIVRNQYGDCKDMSLLLQQMLEAAGIPSRLALIKTLGTVRKDLPSLDQFNHMVVYVPGFKYGFFLDCTANGADLSQPVPVGLARTEALILDPANPRFVSIPDYPADSSTFAFQREVSITNGTDVLVHEVLQMDGYYAGWLRGYLKEIQPASRRIFIETQVNRQAGEVISSKFKNLEDTRAPLVVEMDYVLKRQFQTVGNQLLGKLPAVWEQFYLAADPVEHRVTPFELSFPLKLDSTVILQMPEGYSAPSLEGLRKDVNTAFLSGKATAQKDGKRIRLQCQLQRRNGKFDAADYPEFRESTLKGLGVLEQPIAFSK